VPLSEDEFREDIFKRTFNFKAVYNGFTLFIPFSFDLDKILYSDVHKNSFNTSEFRENWRIESYDEINFCPSFPQ